MRNFKLVIEYDGSGFHGWQIQPEGRTVQGELYRAFGEFSRGDIKITGAGRTDAGVHAVGQVASVLIETPHDSATILKALNAKLPRDILVRSVDDMPLSFNARFDAKRRSYSYYLIRRPTALWKGYYHYVPGDLDIPAMREAAALLPGERDFASFASSSDAGSTRCDMMRAEIIETGPFIIAAFKADRFLYHMVRTLSGTLLEIGKGRKLDIGEILAARDRRMAGPNLPAHALYLMKVEY